MKHKRMNDKTYYSLGLDNTLVLIKSRAQKYGLNIIEHH